MAPQTVHTADRLGDSTARVITPLMVYLPFIVIVIVAQCDKKDAGIGTIISLMNPYTVIVTWLIFFVIWYLLGIPMGPGYPAKL